MKRFAFGISLLATLVLALLLAPAAAQESTPIDPMMDNGGLEYAISRSWSIDYANATPNTSGESPKFQMVIALVMRFETPEQAASALDRYMSDMSEQMETDEFLKDFELVVLDGIGEQASAVGTTVVESEGTWYSRVSSAQEGRYLYSVTAIGADADQVMDADSLLGEMVNNADPGEGDGTFLADGTSTGGPWDVLPTNEHPALAGLISYGDAVHFPEPAVED